MSSSESKRIFAGDTMKGSRKKRSRGALVPALTIVCHPQGRRVGERLRLADLALGREVAISRLGPRFVDAEGREAAALEDSFISRSPLVFASDHTHMTVRAAGEFSLAVDGEPVDGRVRIPLEHLVEGVTLTLADRVVLLLHYARSRQRKTPSYGLVGVSDAIAELRRTIKQVAGTELQVLLRGESGTGKELVAAALHEASARKGRPFVAVNMAALPGAVAASELFGHARGAFTGATRARAGLFQRADGGTLFLDEIGEAAAEVQPLLLRALESGEVRPVGGDLTQTVDVRIIAATDADLEQAVEEGSFRLALLHRLQAYPIEVPPLRERREDVGPLLVHFLREALGEGADARLETPHGEDAWLDVEVVEPLVRYDWPGNVRQLYNVARQLAVANADAEVAELTRAIRRLLPGPSGTDEPPAGPAGNDQIDDEHLREVLKANHFRVGPSARALGISKNTLYRLIERSPLIRKASTLSLKEIGVARIEVGDDPTVLADHLEVSRHGLLLRMRALGMGTD